MKTQAMKKIMVIHLHKMKVVKTRIKEMPQQNPIQVMAVQTIHPIVVGMLVVKTPGILVMKKIQKIPLVNLMMKNLKNTICTLDLYIYTIS